MGDFEKDLQNAFEGAEFAPSPKVWEGVQAGLVPKKKVGIFYMWQTYGIAATIIFLLTMGFLFRDQLFGTGGITTPTQELANEDKAGEEGGSDSGDDKPLKSSAGAISPSKDEVADKNSQDNITTVKDSEAIKGLQAGNSTLKNADDLNADESPSIEKTNQANLTDLAQTAGSESLGRYVGVTDPQTLASDDVNIYVLSPQDFKESIAELRLRWELKNMVGPLGIDTTLLKAPKTNEIVASRTSLNGSLGSGSFTPNGSGLGSGAVENLALLDPAAGSADFVSGEERQLGSLSIGAGIGIELNRRWLLRLGLRYSQYRYAAISNAYFLEDGNPQPLNPNFAFNAADVRFAGEYELTNTIHSISLPVQFGYKLIDRNRFDIMLNAGLGLDYFVSYIVEGDLNFLETRKVDLDESDYLNRFNVNVLTGLEFSYKLNDKLGLSAEIFFRQYIPSLSEVDGGGQATPSFLGFGLGVNYFLRKNK